ncbi:unnamed protein product (macronuclear) [Paramecium tetraurelia]|uniref:PX domain-containing protein n=1 Tax=Paramecium tetraurelia TaxID=5888 RepID=A0C0G3_PARTE|nr:uncharacterized protein GSPATT00006133001 [Paramecium tetraurelia]CAK64280.1 unnamed protein product [Paramecium tetraurelia]|eukprot:XP_001431678.1 hypothetical protein (macronuclear) [Paramecium tetraurelia strain d4-2]
MISLVELTEHRATRSHSQYKLNLIDFDDFAYNLNKTIYNFQKCSTGKNHDKLSKFRKSRSVLKADLQKKYPSVYKTFNRNAPGFDENETKELLEHIIQLEHLFVQYNKYFPDHSNPILMNNYLNCLSLNKEKFFNNYTQNISETLQMSILRNSQQRIADDGTDEVVIKYLINEINRRNKYEKNMDLIRSDQTKFSKLSQNYELHKKTNQLEQTKSNLLVTSMKLVFLNYQNQSVYVRFPLINKNKQLYVDMEKLLKQGDAQDLFKQWSQYVDITSSHPEIILLLSIVQDLLQEDSWIISSIMQQIAGKQIFKLERIILQIGALNQFCSNCLSNIDKSHTQISELLQLKLQNIIPQFMIRNTIKLEKHIMIMQNSQDELNKGYNRHSIENQLLHLNNLKMCLIPQGLFSQLCFIHRYCSENNQNDLEKAMESELFEQPHESNFSHIKKGFIRDGSRKPSMNENKGYIREDVNQPFLSQKLTEMKFASTIFMDNVDKIEWKNIIQNIKEEKKEQKEPGSSQSQSSNISFQLNCEDEQFRRQMKNFLQKQQEKMQ